MLKSIIIDKRKLILKIGDLTQMDNKKEQIIKCIPLNETVQELYGCVNDSCPICEEKFITPTNIQKTGNIIYHLNCYLKVRNNEL